MNEENPFKAEETQNAKNFKLFCWLFFGGFGFAILYAILLKVFSH